MMTQVQFAGAYELGYVRTTQFLMGKGLRPSEAAEFAQAAWTRGWEHREQLQDPRKATMWVNTIALNLYRTQLRRSRRVQNRSVLPEPAVPLPLVAVDIDLDHMLLLCKPNERELLRARYLEGHDIQHLAVTHGCTSTAIRIRLVRARRALREQITALEPFCHFGKIDGQNVVGD